jgi:hypothetical protein
MSVLIGEFWRAGNVWSAKLGGCCCVGFYSGCCILEMYISRSMVFMALNERCSSSQLSTLELVPVIDEARIQKFYFLQDRSMSNNHCWQEHPP